MWLLAQVQRLHGQALPPRHNRPLRPGKEPADSEQLQEVVDSVQRSALEVPRDVTPGEGPVEAGRLLGQGTVAGRKEDLGLVRAIVAARDVDALPDRPDPIPIAHEASHLHTCSLSQVLPKHDRHGVLRDLVSDPEGSPSDAAQELDQLLRRKPHGMGRLLGDHHNRDRVAAASKGDRLRSRFGSAGQTDTQKQGTGDSKGGSAPIHVGGLLCCPVGPCPQCLRRK